MTTSALLTVDEIEATRCAGEPLTDRLGREWRPGTVSDLWVAGLRAVVDTQTLAVIGVPRPDTENDAVDWELVDLARPDAEVAAQTAARLGAAAARDLIDRLNGIVEYVTDQTGATPAAATLAAVTALTDAIGEWT